ncbi:hypothetical protein C8J56DRAFT_1005201 [Mycena floridula]|nr:hypothetical protein C8J56DRAFT_1005201 [Mycena floridula]
MPKSSASAGTRKKHARRAAGPQVVEEPKEKKGKKNKKEVRPKIYIAPIKPTAVRPDPLETTGLAHRLPADLLVVLRNLGKKAVATKSRALADLRAGWIEKADEFEEILVDMLPVWLHHVSSLFIHPSRRIRHLASGIHKSFMEMPATRAQILFLLQESNELEMILGTWILAAHDIDRDVSAAALACWTEAKLELDTSFIQRAALDPNGTYSAVNPPQPVAPPLPAHARKGASRGSVASTPKEDSEGARSKTDEIEEEELDRKARIRVGALGAMKWVLEKSTPSSEFLQFLADTTLWTSLHHAEACPFVAEGTETLGFGSPNVRKAGWALLQAVLKLDRCELSVKSSRQFYAPAWVEPDVAVQSTMWRPLLTFLKEFPMSWTLDRDYTVTTQPIDDDSESDNEEEEKKEETDEVETPTAPKRSIAYAEFLQFLQLGCSGSPLQGYPAVVIILSTLSSPILASVSDDEPPLSHFFTSFWAAIDGRALSSLQRAATTSAFLSSLLECMVFLVRRIQRGGDHAVTLARKSEYSTRRHSAAIDQGLGRAVEYSFSHLHSRLGHLDRLVSTMLNAFRQQFTADGAPRIASQALMANILQDALEQAEGAVKAQAPNEDPIVLVHLLEVFRTSLFENATFADRMDSLVAEDVYRLLSVSPTLFVAYLSHRNDASKCLEIWHNVLSVVAAHQDGLAVSLSRLLDAVQKHKLSRDLKPQSSELDKAFLKLVKTDLKPSEGLEVFSDPFFSAYFLTPAGLKAALKFVAEKLINQVEDAMINPEIPFNTIEPPLDILSSAILAGLKWDSMAYNITPTVFVCAFLMPKCTEEQCSGFEVAKKLWPTVKEASPPEETYEPPGQFLSTKAYLMSLLLNTKSRATQVYSFAIKTQSLIFFRSAQIMEVARMFPDCDFFKELFPSPSALDHLLDFFSPDPIDSTLAVDNPIIPLASEFSKSVENRPHFNYRGFSSYAEVVTTMLDVCLDNRQAAKENMWALRHFMALALYIEDYLAVPHATSPMFDPEALKTDLKAVLVKIETLTTYILTSPSRHAWKRVILASLIEDTSAHHHEPLSVFLIDVLQYATFTDNSRDNRILWATLRHILKDTDKIEADAWLAYSKHIEPEAPKAALTIVAAIARFAPEPARFERHRTELATSLPGIKPAKANTDGLKALRKLNASAPNPDSEVAFLTAPRAVNAVKACQQWIASDEDIGEDVESEMTELFLHLAPILQNVPGSHWDFIFDVLESNLENASFDEPSSFVSLARTLRLIIAIQDLASTNKGLKADWEQRQIPILTAVRDLATVELDRGTGSHPRSVCRELVLFIVQDLPDTLIDLETLPKMCHLLTDPSAEVQRRTFQLLQQAAKKRTEHFVIEAAVDSDDTFWADLPPELLSIHVFGHLLGWMLLLDLFIDSSLKVRLSYLDQLRTLEIIPTYLMPNILMLLSLDQGTAKAFKLDVWAVDEYHVQYYEPGNTFSLRVLAAHVYYRALLTVPSLIHSWLQECKDRQVSTAITAFTSSHFSPVIIRRELAHVKSPEALKDLENENLKIKVSSSGSVNEVVASYLVDEHQLEIKLRIPGDWPLHRIDVKDVQRVGVDENRWRAWIFGVQQTIWAQNGRIIEGLELFKKNVTLHFEGQVECAICYSIISVMDGSLPKKPCKTCKNRFHAGCLFKWFNTSHSSSCPLCRSDIL